MYLLSYLCMYVYTCMKQSVAPAACVGDHAARDAGHRVYDAHLGAL